MSGRFTTPVKTDIYGGGTNSNINDTLITGSESVSNTAIVVAVYFGDTNNSIDSVTLSDTSVSPEVPQNLTFICAAGAGLNYSVHFYYALVSVSASTTYRVDVNLSSAAEMWAYAEFIKDVHQTAPILSYGAAYDDSITTNDYVSVKLNASENDITFSGLASNGTVAYTVGGNLTAIEEHTTSDTKHIDFYAGAGPSVIYQYTGGPGVDGGVAAVTFRDINSSSQGSFLYNIKPFDPRSGKIPKINWNNPLTKGLSNLWIVTPYGVVDLIGNARQGATVNNANYQEHPTLGPILDTRSNDTDSYQILDNGAKDVDPDNCYGGIVVGDPGNTTSANWQGFMIGRAVVGEDWGLFLDNATPRNLSSMHNDVGWASSGPEVVSDKVGVFGFATKTNSGGGADLCRFLKQDGEVFARSVDTTSILTANNVPNDATDIDLFADSSSSARTLHGDFKFAALWKKDMPWDAAKQAALCADPWQLFEPEYTFLHIPAAVASSLSLNVVKKVRAKQPTGFVGIDKNNPLTKNLVFCPTIWNGPDNIVDAVHPTIKGAVTGTPSMESARDFRAVNFTNRINFPNVPHRIAQGEFTILIIYKWNTGGGNYQTSISINNNLGIYLPELAASPYMASDTLTVGTVTFTSTSVDSDDKYHSFAMTCEGDNTTPKAYKDGVFSEDGSHATLFSTFGGISDIDIGYGQTTELGNGATPFIAVFDKVLTAGEIKSLHNNPWQLFEPEYFYLFSGTDAGAGGVSLTLTGVSSTGQTGELVVIGNAVTTLSGTQTTGQVGLLQAIGGAIASLSGVQGSGQIGTLSAIGNALITLDGASTVGQAGDLTAIGNAIVNLSGVSTIGQAGDLTIVISGGGSVAVTLSGVSVEGQVGSLSVIGSALVELTGVQTLGQVGSLSALEGIIVSLSGVSTTGQVGVIDITGHAIVDVIGVQVDGEVGVVSINTGVSEAILPEYRIVKVEHQDRTYLVLSKDDTARRN